MAAFGAGELILRKNEKEKRDSNRSLYEVLEQAKLDNKQIENMIPKIEDSSMKENIGQINSSVTKIINTIEKKPSKYNRMSNFFDYYLPRTLVILKKYDEIENQRLNTEESQKFMKQTQNMIKKINQAFNSQLSNLYQSDIVDTDAEMKVFDSMLKADGYDTTSDFKYNKGDKKSEE